MSTCQNGLTALTANEVIVGSNPTVDFMKETEKVEKKMTKTVTTYKCNKWREYLRDFF